MNRRICTIFSFLLILLLAGGILSCKSGTSNLLINSGFENGDIEGWVKDLWNKEGTIEVVTDYVYKGNYALKISSPDVENDIRLSQLVNVQPKTYYKLSGWIATRDVQENRVGANICLTSGFDYTGNVAGTEDWTYFELLFKTSKAHKTINIAARLGMYYNTVKGTGYFDELSLEKIKSAPESSIILKEPEGDQSKQDKEIKEKKEKKQTKEEKEKKEQAFLILLLIAIGLSLISVNVFITIYREKKNDTHG